MSSETGEWITLIQWVINNPDKSALALVLGMGAWRWVRELKKEFKDERFQESFTETLMKENKELRTENKELIKELKEARSQRPLPPRSE